MGGHVVDVFASTRVGRWLVVGGLGRKMVHCTVAALVRGG